MNVIEHMNNQWNLLTLQQYVADGVQESLTLEYKAAEALEKSDAKKKEITKDVSAMANSVGGILIYGMKEHSETGKKHLPEKLDPVDQRQFSKEWLEQVINTIRPRINGVCIYPVPISDMPNHVIYVVDIPQSTTAHQASDWRYYKRFNFQSIPMEDYEIRDVMNRGSTPDAHIELGLFRELNDTQPYACRRLRIKITNQGVQVINRFKLILRLKNIGWSGPDDFHVTDLVEVGNDKSFSYSYWSGEDNNLDMNLVYESTEVLFPKESINIGGYKINWVFPDDVDTSNDQWASNAQRQKWSLEWTLYADNMLPKKSEVMIHELVSA